MFRYVFMSLFVFFHPKTGSSDVKHLVFFTESDADEISSNISNKSGSFLLRFCAEGLTNHVKTSIFLDSYLHLASDEQTTHQFQMLKVRLKLPCSSSYAHKLGESSLEPVFVLHGQWNMCFLQMKYRSWYRSPLPVLHDSGVKLQGVFMYKTHLDSINIFAVQYSSLLTAR